MRPSTKKQHVSRWTAIRVIKPGGPSREYSLDQSGRLRPSVVPRNPRRVLTKKSDVPPPVRFSIPTQERKEDPFELIDLPVVNYNEPLEFEDTFGSLQFQYIDDPDFLFGCPKLFK